MNGLEQQANAMFDAIVHSGFAAEDRKFVDIALSERDRFAALTEAAIDAGDLDLDSLFDSDYRPIAGSDPERFDTRLNGFADRVWRPELDRIVAGYANVVSNACTDRNGYLPTHTTLYSRVPTGDPVHDAAHCRHRRILLDEGDIIAKTSEKPFHLAVYRRESDGGGFHVVRNVYAPLVIKGRRWGDYELAYWID